MQIKYAYHQKEKKILFIPASFFEPRSFCGVFKSIQVRFLSHIFKYSQAYILLILLLWFFFFFFLKNQIICLNCLYLDGSLDLIILNHKFIIQIICLNYLYYNDLFIWLFLIINCKFFSLFEWEIYIYIYIYL